MSYLYIGRKSGKFRSCPSSRSRGRRTRPCGMSLCLNVSSFDSPTQKKTNDTSCRSCIYHTTRAHVYLSPILKFVLLHHLRLTSRKNAGPSARVRNVENIRSTRSRSTRREKHRTLPRESADTTPSRLDSEVRPSPCSTKRYVPSVCMARERRSERGDRY